MTRSGRMSAAIPPGFTTGPHSSGTTPPRGSPRQRSMARHSAICRQARPSIPSGFLAWGREQTRRQLQDSYQRENHVGQGGFAKFKGDRSHFLGPNRLPSPCLPPIFDGGREGIIGGRMRVCRLVIYCGGLTGPVLANDTRFQGGQERGRSVSIRGHMGNFGST